MGRGIPWRRGLKVTRQDPSIRAGLAFSLGMTVFKERRLLVADSGMGRLQIALKLIGGLETAVL